MSMNQVASDLYKALTESDERKPKPYDTKAEVLRTEGNTVWVKIPGGVDETPVQKTNNANPGDQVMVRISGGRAWLLGNETSPATDDTQANAAVQLAEGAGEMAKIASDSATEAQASAEKAYRYADDAYTSAQEAGESAASAKDSATHALYDLGIVEDIVGILDLLAKNGNYTETLDTEPIENKWYFQSVGTVLEPEYAVVTEIPTEYLKTKDTLIDAEKTYYEYDSVEEEYVEVETPIEADLGNYYEYSNSPYLHGYYELTSIKDAIRNYVSSQLVLTSAGLWLMNPNINTRLLLSSQNGMQVISDGKVLASYGTEARIGDPESFHITLTNNRLGFWRGVETSSANEIAYISGEQLYITKSVVLQQMDLGITALNGGLGQWSWKVHANGDAEPRNNLNLKWIG